MEKVNPNSQAQANSFDGLVAHIQQTQDVLQSSARLVINRHVTAKYGERLLQNLAERLKDKKAFSYRSLKLYRQFYLVYSSLDSQVLGFVKSYPRIGQTLSAQLQSSVLTSPNMLFNKLSLSHLSLLLPLKDPLERAFYETMAIRGTWSVRELQRQIDSNYYYRSGWSQKPEALAKLVDGKAETDSLAWASALRNVRKRCSLMTATSRPTWCSTIGF